MPFSCYILFRAGYHYYCCLFTQSTAAGNVHSLIVTVVVSLLLFPSLCPKYVVNISSTPWHQCIHLLNQKSLNRLKLYKIQQKKKTNNQENRTNDSSFKGSAHWPQNRSEMILLITFKGLHNIYSTGAPP